MTVRPLADLKALRAAPGFAPFAAGQLVSALGDAVVPVALALAVLQLSHSPLMLGVVLATSLLARVVSLLIGGVYADQTSRWLIMAVADGVRLLVQGLAGVLLVTHHANVGTLLVLGILYGAAAGMFAPASSGLLPELVTRDHLQQANAVLGLGRNVARILGPLTAALIVAVASPGWAFLIDATSFAVDGVILLAIGRRLGVARRQPTPLGPALRDGLVELRGRPWYLANLGVHSLWNVAMAGFYVLGPAVVLATSGVGPGVRDLRGRRHRRRPRRAVGDPAPRPRHRQPADRGGRAAVAGVGVPAGRRRGRGRRRAGRGGIDLRQ
jgi:hypothetical protein